MENTNETVAILHKHVETAISLIKALKRRVQKLEGTNQLLVAENKRHQESIAQHSERIRSYEEKMSELEFLLDEAQKEQVLLEQSILTAISGLSVAEEEITKDPSLRDEIQNVQTNYTSSESATIDPIDTNSISTIHTEEEDDALTISEKESLDVDDISDIASIAESGDDDDFTEIKLDEDDLSEENLVNTL